MDNLIKVRFVKVSHPDTRSSTRRMIYNVLQNYAVETPFGFVLLDPSVWDRLMYLNERARAEVGRDVVYYIDVYMPKDEFLKMLRNAILSEEIEPTSTKYLYLKRLLDEIGIGVGVEV